MLFKKHKPGKKPGKRTELRKRIKELEKRGLRASKMKLEQMEDYHKRERMRIIGQRRREILFEHPKTKKLLDSLSEKERKEAIKLKDHNPAIRTEGIENLAGINSKKSIPLIEAMLKDNYFIARKEAIKALAILGSKKSIPLIKKRLNDSYYTVRKEASNALGALGNAKLTELYRESAFDKKFKGKKRRIMRREQEKTGTRTILLGGKLFGKATIRIIPEHSFIEWKKAFEAGLAVEPILKRKEKYRAYKNKDGTINVTTGVINGQSLYAFFLRKKNAKYRAMVEAQMKSIEEGLDKLFIKHGHIHQKNFAIQWKRIRLKKFPKVFLIDFDQAVDRYASTMEEE